MFAWLLSAGFYGAALGLAIVCWLAWRSSGQPDAGRARPDRTWSDN